MPLCDTAARVTCVATASSPWKYMTIRRPAASTCTSGEAMCGVVISESRSWEMTVPFCFSRASNCATCADGPLAAPSENTTARVASCPANVFATAPVGYLRVRAGYNGPVVGEIKVVIAKPVFDPIGYPDQRRTLNIRANAWVQVARNDRPV